MKKEDFITRAIELSQESAQRGGKSIPFGALIVREDRILVEAYNQVHWERDPTSHAEIVAIRGACRKLGTHKLSGCILYASCEPCPMCYAAAYWASIEKIYYAMPGEKIKPFGYDDIGLYNDLAGSGEERQLVSIAQIPDPRAFTIFKDWFDGHNQLNRQRVNQ
uniref:tRNA(Arg) A34 adenosine deaminase TadA n=1 Tax=Candidatus Kentrum sp. MB TaxID=2138164 RepID=A0A450XD32_9GAMM|nr:MAG: tRNA(Arg) A34 adenosine deaminase TadA [Candidatus Kentron sp. MB]VFK27203.1 MAG: tRNA(Arg) A34 adenosine deaminase TadA [Candidatus Kentron sp. MB]VFK75090.1 MAG: tRNA(Arg) A34 adenosine deaminase TadA [Candidatus Kentron sp. MB]